MVKRHRDNTEGLAMKIERINENKIKVMIDDAEAREWNITVKNISENTPEVQKMFWRAINMAKTDADFSVDGAKLFVETLQPSSGGIGMLITRVCSESDLKSAVQDCAYKGKLRFRELRPSAGVVKRRKYIYKFDSFDDVCSAVEVLGDRYSGISALYNMEDEYYLYMVPSDTAAFGDTNMLLSEFAERVPHSQFVHGRLNEYGQAMIGESAVDVLRKHFIN